ncbi:ribonuclease D [Agrococcus versicolor]|uniref:Ribonuclease D n=1 Tax=Agrococcus versicolor TaxID=501482 RepID=A0ABP5MG02_9MICO
MTDATAADAPQPELVDAVPVGPLDVVVDDEGLRAAIARLLAGTGPIGVDAERANGFRYSSRAYLVQLYRRGSGTVLLDPLGITAWSELQDAIGGEEWVLHAASQDLPCLRELGLEPATLFDTELGARLAGYERVGLAAVVERLLGIRLMKEHAASDWSRRPIEPALLAYAALDVELIVDLRDAMAADLEAQGKAEIARQEFEAARTRLPKPPAAEPWRRLSGLHQVKDRRTLAIARALWEARDAYAREIDGAPGRLIGDAALMAAATSGARTKAQLAATSGFHGRASRSQLDRWLAALEAGRAAEDLPVLRTPADGPPPPRFWRQKRPVAATRLQRARAAVQAIADELSMPNEQLLTPDTLRRLTWDHGAEPSVEAVRNGLAALGARPWQIDATAQRITLAFVDADQTPDEPSDVDS